MKKALLLFCIILLSISYRTQSQTCPGDVVILEDENLSIWKVASNNSQIFSLAEFQGNVNVGGTDYFQDEFDFDARGLILMAHDITGGLLWSTQIQGTSFFTTNPALAADASHVYLSATSSENGNAEHQLKIEQYGALDGTPGWSNVYVISNSGSSPLPFEAQINPYSAGIDGSGRLIIAGTFANNVDIGGAMLSTAPGISETFVMAVDTGDGTDLWATQSNGSANRGRAWTLEISPTDEVIIGGHFTGSIDFGGPGFTASDDASTNPYIAKLNAIDGAQIWLQGFDGQTPGSFNNIYDITTDPSGNVYYAGAFFEAIDVQGNVVNSGLSGDGGVDALIGAMDPNGDYLWANQLGGKSTGNEFATTIVFSGNATSLYAGVQLGTDSLYYQNNFLDDPVLSGHYVFGVAPADGSTEPNFGDIISNENNFGYSAQYLDVSDTYISASLINGTGVNTKVAQWIPNRPIPIVDVTLEDGVLDPTETLTAFDPGGGSYTYQWFFNGAAIPGELTATYTATVNGEYYVEITGQGGCPIQSESFFLLDGSTLESDSLALVELYNNTDGANWVENTNWLQPGTLVRDWFGVIVSGDRVTEINLQSNNLNGTFPNSLPQLGELTELRLGGNFLSGELPENIGNLTNLVGFEIWNNQMSGPIPASIGNMTNLVRFYATSNSFSGPLPNEIGNLALLEGLAFNDNQITGPIPVTIQNLTSASYVELINNPINDVIPPEIGSMPSLQFIQLENTQLTGNIPASLGNLTGLIGLNLSINSLEGTIPTELTTINTLQEINVRENQLSGTMPDGIWQLPSLQVIQVDFNPDLTVNLPANLASLTQLTILGISGVVPIGGQFPEEFYSLTNLTVLDVGGHNFTGTITTDINNLTNLSGLWLFRNKLTGDFPDISSLINLQAGSIGGNEFTSFPDISALPQLGFFEIAFNQLDFNSIIPNLSIPDFQFSPQNRRPTVYDEVVIGGTLELVNPYATAGNQYQWIRNINDSIANTQNYTITGATVNDLGGYFAWVTNPAVPDLTLSTPFYNISFSGEPQAFFVDNSENSVADFKSFYSAFYGTSTGDTLYVAGSVIPYDIGGLVLERQRYVYGPGYFLNENPETQSDTLTASVPFINIRPGSEGTEMYGMDFGTIFINNIGSASNDVVSDVTFSHNRIGNIDIVDDADNITISKNYLDKFIFASTTVTGTSREYSNITISNNIIDTVSTTIARASAARNTMDNVVFDRNTIGVFLDSIQDVSITNNIINDYQATGNTVSGTIDFATANFENNSGSLSIDNDFQTAATVGAFSGGDPYILSGIAPIPHIFSLEDIGRIRLNLEAKNEIDSDIISLNYVLGENGEVKQLGDVRRLEAGNPVEVTFRPKLGNITPGASINLLIWAEDARGVKSVPQSLVFEAETTTATGQILTSTGSPVTDGEVLLFEINQEETAFDTLATNLNNQGSFTFNNIVIGDYLALGNPDRDAFPGQLPTYFTETDLWEEADTLLIDTDNPDFSITLIEEPREETGVGRVAGFVDEELDDNNDGGRIDARGRVRRAGVSMRRARRLSRSEEVVFDLVSYVFTDDNGEFFFDNLPPAEYRINIQYPGFPMDTLSDIDIIIEESRNNDYNIAALVDEGKISVTILSTTGVLEQLIKQVNVYPNPAVEIITLEFKEGINLAGDLKMELISTKGERVFEDTISADKINSERKYVIPVSLYGNGTYILSLANNTGALGTIRLMIMK